MAYAVDTELSYLDSLKYTNYLVPSKKKGRIRVGCVKDSYLFWQDFLYNNNKHYYITYGLNAAGLQTI
jgi:hypothetical protein